MTSARWASVAGLIILVATGCESAEPTAPALGAPSAAAPAENHGNGSQFTPVSGFTDLVVLADDNGNSCDIGYSDQPGAKGRSDFFRTTPVGGTAVHTSDSDAPLTIEYQGLLYQGFGHAVADGEFDPTAGRYAHLVVNATGQVVGPDGETYEARCMGRLSSDGFSLDATIDVH
jgi:hypothetical protein